MGNDAVTFYLARFEKIKELCLSVKYLICGPVSAIRVSVLIEYLAAFTQSNKHCEYVPKAVFGTWLMKDDASHIMKCKVI